MLDTAFSLSLFPRSHFVMHYMIFALIVVCFGSFVLCVSRDHTFRENQDGVLFIHLCERRSFFTLPPRPGSREAAWQSPRHTVGAPYWLDLLMKTWVDKAIPIINLDSFGRTKTVSKSGKGTVNSGHREGRLLTPAACFLGLCTNWLKWTIVTLYPSSSFPYIYCYCVQEGHMISGTM